MAPRRGYTNPVYDGYMADPFVLKFNGEYYAYGTAPHEERAIPILHSTDLVQWNRIGEACIELDGDFGSFWAPEVAYNNGTFYMYYSSGGEEGEGHRLRVAASNSPGGPFVDAGVVLVPDEPFSIDAHPFRDDDGQWYLYYSKDFLEGDRVGTGIVVDRMPEMTRLAGEPRVVVRPTADWQLYMRQRNWYERVWDWYTVEGPCVRKHGAAYYCFYSGGAWREPNYGVSWDTAAAPLGPFAGPGAADAPGLLRTRPGEVIGPGHVSIALGPDNVQQYLFYHAWDPDHTGRMMRMERLRWDERGPVPLVPSVTPQPAPPPPAFRELFDAPQAPGAGTPLWRFDGGQWCITEGELRQEDDSGPALAEFPVGLSGERFLLEVNARALAAEAGGRWGVRLAGSAAGGNAELVFAGAPLRLAWRVGSEEQLIDLSRLGTDLRPEVYHQLLVRCDAGAATVLVDGVPVATGVPLPAAVRGLSLVTGQARAAFDGVTVSRLDG